MHSDEHDSREDADKPLRPTRHRIYRNWIYLGIHGEIGVEHGDGTLEWLLDALRRRPRDSWGPERDSWYAVRSSWGTDAEDAA